MPRGVASSPSGPWAGHAAWASLPYAQQLLGASGCVRASSGHGAGLAPACQANASTSLACTDNECGHGAHMLPYLVRRYGARTIAEIGVCTGMSSVAVLDAMLQHGEKLERYYLIDACAHPLLARTCACAGHAPLRGPRRAPPADPATDPRRWAGGSPVCNPGCGCHKPLRKVASSFPELQLLRGYSVPMSASVPNASLDIAFVDAAHDFGNARADMLAYWPKVKPGGVLAGHDFAHTRNWAQVREEWASGKRPLPKKHGGRIPPSYGVGQATQELFGHCQVNVRFNVWWIEAATCSGPRVAAAAAAIGPAGDGARKAARRKGGRGR